MKNKWLKKGILLLTVGCLTFSMTGCKGEDVVNSVLEKVGVKKAEEKSTETKKEETQEPEVEVAKPELTVNLSGSVTYQKGAEAEPLKVEATASDNGEISYQWYQSLTNINGGGTAIEGETGSTFTPPTKEAGTVYYYAVATNTIGSSTNRVTSDTAEVIVSEAGAEAAEGEEAQSESTGTEASGENKTEEKQTEEKQTEEKQAEENKADNSSTEKKEAEGTTAGAQAAQ